MKILIFSINMNSGMNSPGAAAANCKMKYSGGYEKAVCVIMAEP